MTSLEKGAPREALIEALAEKLYQARTLGGGDWNAVAEEALRQMEWARRRGVKLGLVSQGLRQGLVVNSASGETETTAICAKDPLTLAPEDWKP